MYCFWEGEENFGRELHGVAWRNTGCAGTNSKVTFDPEVISPEKLMSRQENKNVPMNHASTEDVNTLSKINP